MRKKDQQISVTRSMGSYLIAYSFCRFSLCGHLTPLFKKDISIYGVFLA